MSPARPQHARALGDRLAAPALERGRGGRQLRLDGGGRVAARTTRKRSPVAGLTLSIGHGPNLTHDQPGDAFGPMPDEVPVVGQGTWQMAEGRHDATEIAALRAGIARGLTHIDTAEMYGGGAPRS